MSVNLADKFSSRLDQPFTKNSFTDAYVNRDYDFDGVDTIHVYTVQTVELSDYNRASTGDRYGGNNELQDVVTSYKLTKDKSFKIAIDKGNYEQSMRAKRAGVVLRAQINERVIPAIDMDRMAAAAAGAIAVGQTVTATANAYDDTLALRVYLDEAKAPLTNRVLMVTPAEYKLIKEDIVTTVNAQGYNDKLLSKGFVGTLDGTPVVMVPSSYFPSGVHALMWHKDALLGARQLTEARIKTDSELISGSLLLGRYIFGSFVLNGKKNGVAALVSGSSAS